MKLAFDIQTLQTFEAKRGIGRACLEILQNILAADNVNEYFFVIRGDFAKPDLSFLKAGKYRIFEVKSEEDFNSLFGIVDVYISTSPLMSNILFPTNRRGLAYFAAYIHDLIPLIENFNGWSNEMKAEYNRRIDFMRENLDIGFCNSECTKNDLINLAKFENIKLKVAHLGISREFMDSETKKVDGLPNKYIFSLGGNNPRKNSEGLIKAYELLPENIRNEYSLVLVGDYPDTYQEELRDMLGYKDMQRLYIYNFLHVSELKYVFKNASLFVFPSTYEGFGLPLLEAISLNVPVITAGNSSLKEIISNTELQFDAGDVKDISLKILESLQIRNNHTKIDISRFSYSNCAQKIIDGLNETRKRSLEMGSIKSRKKLAWFAPDISTRSGIAYYSAGLIPYLSKYFDITWFTNSKTSQGELTRYYKEFDPYRFEHIIYNIGNNEVNEFAYRTAHHHTGILLVHDLIIDDFLKFINKDKPEEYIKIIEEAKKESKGSYEPLAIMPLVLKSKSVITSNIWSANQILARSPEAYVKVISHFAEISKIPRTSRRKFTVGTFGYVNPHKRVDVVINAFANALEVNPDMHLVIVGEMKDKICRDLITNKGLEENVTVTGFVDDKEFIKNMHSIDLNINLRFPTQGETSGPLVQAVASGVPSIVNDINQFSEYPNKFVWKVGLNRFEQKLLCEYILELSKNKEALDKMSKHALDYAYSNLDPEFIAYNFYKTLNG